MFADTFTEHVIRDLVELNYGEDEPYPTLTPGDLSANKAITSAALAELMDAGAVRPDDALEAQTRAQYGLPLMDSATIRETAAKTPTAGTPAPTAALSGPDPVMDRAEALIARLAQLKGSNHV